MFAEATTASALRLEISDLEVKIGEVQALVEKREMEVKIAMQREVEARHCERAKEVGKSSTFPEVW